MYLDVRETGLAQEPISELDDLEVGVYLLGTQIFNAELPELAPPALLRTLIPEHGS